MHSPGFASTLTLLGLAFLLLTTTCSANNTPPREIVVKRGQKIQDAIDRAANYTKIIIERGEYKEQLVIRKDGIELFGKPLARLIPPDVYTDNICTGIAGNITDIFNNQGTIPTQNGICVIGNVRLEAFKEEHQRVEEGGVTHYIKDVKISGLQVSNFTGMNVAVVGGKDTQIEKNQLFGGQRYGFLTLGSINTKFEKNGVTGTGPSVYAFIGVCNDDKSDVKIWNNEVQGYITGLCVQTNGADIRGNHVSQTCYGAFVDPGVVGAQLRWNHIRETARICADFPFPATAGINVGGAQKTEVRWNYIQNITAYGVPDRLGIGIGVFDFREVASGNVVRDNYLKLNDLDILFGATGAGNIAKNNLCTNDPTNFCKSGGN